LFLGHDFRRKGLREAIQVIAEARRRRPECPWQLLVVGRDRPGPYRALARRLGLGSAVAFVGSVYPPDDCFGTAEVLLFPTWYDPFANVTLESLAFGVPVITTRQNGGSEAIEPGVNGWVVSEPEAIGEMADALALAGDPARRAGLREAARAAAGRLDLTGQLRAVESVLFAVAEERRAAGERGDGRPG